MNAAASLVRESPWENLDYRAASLQRDGAHNVCRKLSDVVGHEIAPCSPSTDRAGDMGETIGNKPRNCGEARVVTRTSLHVRLVQHVTEPSKVVAKKVGASIDTVDSHRQGNVPQSWAQMIAYCRAYPAFGLEVLELIGIDIDRDRDAYAIFLTLQKRVRGE